MAYNFIERGVHGALDFAELEKLGFSPGEIIDFSVNSNPYGPSPEIAPVLSRVTLDRYPDRESLLLRRAILEYELAGTDLTPSNIVVGNGGAELIWTVARALLFPGSKTVIIGPTFGEYRTATLAAGSKLVEFRTESRNGFKLVVPELIDYLKVTRPELLWLCNPNNPTGSVLEPQDLKKLVELCWDLDTTMIVDEAYWRFSGEQNPVTAADWLQSEGKLKLVVVRSLTKDYAIAGLRLGFLATSNHLARLISAQLPPWNVNSLAQAAGVVALQDQNHLRTTLLNLQEERNAFFKALRGAGLKTVPSSTHFTLVEVGNARETRHKLLAQKLLVRDCSSFGLPDFIRVSTRPAPDWPNLVGALEEILEES